MRHSLKAVPGDRRLTNSLAFAVLFSVTLCSIPRPGFAGLSAASFSLQPFYTGTYDHQICTGDLDTDGRLDFVVETDVLDCRLPLVSAGTGCSVYRRVLIFWGGGLDRPDILHPGSSQNLVAIGDVDGNGRDDLVMGYADSVEIRLGTGTRTLGRPFRVSVGLPSSHLLVADMDGDGHGDIVVGPTGTSLVRVFRGGGGSPYFATEVDFPSTYENLIRSYQNLILGDFNLDGRLDILATKGAIRWGDSAGVVSVRLADGNGGYGPAVTSQVGSHWVVAADLNRDGWLDLFNKSGQSFFGDGQGHFGPLSAPRPARDPSRSTPVPAGWRRDAAPLAISSQKLAIAGDFDGDGGVDILGAELRDTLAIYRGLGDGRVEPRSKIRVPNWAHRIVAGDFTGDGRLDAVILHLDQGDGSSVLLRNIQQQGTPTSPLVFSTHRDQGRGVLEWHVDPDRMMNSYAVKTNSGEGFRTLTSVPLARQRDYAWIDFEVGPEPRDYWIEELTRTGVVNLYGPAHLPGVGVRPAPLSLGISANPVRESTVIGFELPADGPVRLDLLNSTGRLQCCLLEASMPGGRSSFAWDGRAPDGKRLAAGAYFLRLTAGGGSRTLKILVVG